MAEDRAEAPTVETSAQPAPGVEDLVLAVELEASRRDPYRQMSRLFHLLGRRR